MHVQRIVTVIGVTSAAVALTAGSAWAAAPQTGAHVPPLKNTIQTIDFQQHRAGYKDSAAVSFGKKTFTIGAYGDSGTFRERKTSLTMLVTSASDDQSCAFSATYDAADATFVGTYSCPNGPTDVAFELTTGVSADHTG